MIGWKFDAANNNCLRAVVVVSGLNFYSKDPSRILLTPTIFYVNFVFENNENHQKDAGVGPFKN